MLAHVETSYGRLTVHPRRNPSHRHRLLHICFSLSLSLSLSLDRASYAMSTVLPDHLQLLKAPPNWELTLRALTSRPCHAVQKAKENHPWHVTLTRRVREDRALCEPHARSCRDVVRKTHGSIKKKSIPIAIASSISAWSSCTKGRWCKSSGQCTRWR